MWLLNKISCEIQILNEKVGKLMIENVKLKEENRLLKNEIVWLKDHTKYNSLTEEEYIDGTMTATEAKLRLEQARQNQIYVSNLEEENRKLKLHIEAKDKAYTALLKDYEELKEDNKRLKAEIGEWLNAIRQKI